MNPVLSHPMKQDELFFVQAHLKALTSMPINYSSEFVTPLERRPRKMGPVKIAIQEPPELKRSQSGNESSTATPISVTIKSLKPSFTVTLSSISPLTTISALKIAFLSSPSVVPSNLALVPQLSDVRFLLKGKAMVDANLLKEYLTEDGTITLMLKAGWEKEAKEPVVASSKPPSEPTPVEPANTVSPLNPLQSPALWKDVLKSLSTHLPAREAKRIFAEFLDSQKFDETIRKEIEGLISV